MYSLTYTKNGLRITENFPCKRKCKTHLDFALTSPLCSDIKAYKEGKEISIEEIRNV
ncbi:hypothetical protein Emin_0955 [Elusimicrobium minutum Pei191]|uniref:Uncharacterized protein n=1 Tax=Elusimicrobium minutum (strain Pei191) TaxID=445932 RepID=B2KDB2_ELUMP|nr:hypothetical protein [Elusimicrobium minutum]ACC98508.1 hypothetical protein Emin_0955 [Elusimicrobium minutum Pei191]